MIIAMMNNTLNQQSVDLDRVWLIDVSYRIMRFERLLPELAERMQQSQSGFSIWSWNYWKSTLYDVCLVFYCIPEIHCFGVTRIAYFYIKSALLLVFGSKQEMLSTGLEKLLLTLGREVQENVEKRMKFAEGCIGSLSRVNFFTWSIAGNIVALARRGRTAQQAQTWIKIVNKLNEARILDADSKDETLMKGLLLLMLIHQVHYDYPHTIFQNTIVPKYLCKIANDLAPSVPWIPLHCNLLLLDTLAIMM